MRYKLDDGYKKISISITVDPILLKIFDGAIKENHTMRSKVIEKLIKDYLEVLGKDISNII